MTLKTLFLWLFPWKKKNYFSFVLDFLFRSFQIEAPLLVFLFKDISLGPELSSPPRVRILGGSPDPDELRTEIYVFNIW